MSLRPRYSRAFKLDPPGTELTHIEGRGHRHHDGAAEAPHGAQEPAGGGAPLPPKADQRRTQFSIFDGSFVFEVVNFEN